MNEEQLNRNNTSLPEEDDGRTIVNMNVEGMPWYVPEDEKKARRNNPGGQDSLTKEQLRMYRWAALKAGLLVVLVFGVVFFLYILFCDVVLFR